MPNSIIWQKVKWIATIVVAKLLMGTLDMQYIYPSYAFSTDNEVR